MQTERTFEKDGKLQRNKDDDVKYVTSWTWNYDGRPPSAVFEYFDGLQWNERNEQEIFFFELVLERTF